MSKATTERAIAADFLSRCEEQLIGIKEPDILLLACAVLRALSIDSWLNPLGLDAWDRLMNGRTSHSSQRFLNCCEEIDKANPQLNGTWKQVARRSIGDGAEAAKEVKKICDVAQQFNSRQFSCNVWHEIAELLSRQSCDPTWAPLGSVVTGVLEILLPEGDCLVYAGISDSLAEWNSLQAARQSDGKVYVREAAEPMRIRALTQLLAYVSLSEHSVTCAPLEARKYSSAVVAFPQQLSKRRLANQAAAQIRNLRSVYNELDDSGTLFAVVRDGLLFGDGAEEEFRREMISEGAVDALVLIPGTRGPRTAVAHSLLKLSKKTMVRESSHVRFVDASNLAYSSPDGSYRGANPKESTDKIVRALTTSDLAEFNRVEGHLSVDTRRIASEPSCSWDMDRYGTKLSERMLSDIGLEPRLLEKIKQRDELTKTVIDLLRGFGRS